MKLNNKGLTLVELVIAIAISTMIVGAAGMFLYNAERTYRVAEHSINLQMEAQILMEQMSNWIMEGNKIFVAETTHDADEDSTVINDVLVIYYIPRDNGKDISTLYPTAFTGAPGYDASRNNASCRVIFSYDGKLYMKTRNNISNANTEYQALLTAGNANALYSSADATPENEIGEYVYRFHCDKVPSDVAVSDLSSVLITLGMVEGKQSYTMTDTFSLRNGLHTIPTPTPAAGEEGGDPGDEG